MATIDYGNPSVVSGDMGVGRVRRAVGALRRGFTALAAEIREMHRERAVRRALQDLGPHLLRDIGMD